MTQKTILITGATGYFGKALVSDLAHNYRIIATSRRLDKLHQMFPASNILKAEMDLYDLPACEAQLQRLCEGHDIYGLINNAYDFSAKTGFNTPDGRMEQISTDAMRCGLESGILAPMVFCKLIGTQMIRKKIAGSIINISSMYGTIAPDSRLYEGKAILNPVTYSVAKAGLNALTRYLASFWGPHGIRCNAVAPGSFPNVETDSVNAPKDTEFIHRLEAKTCLGRTGHPRDLLGVIALLLSDKASYITGQVLGVDGGWTTI